MMNYLRFRSVVFLENDESSILVGVMELADIFRIGSLELVDRLVIIPDGEDIRTLDTDGCDAINESHLSVVRILEFIDHDELILFREAHTDDIMLFDEFDRLEDHIREVDESAFSEGFLIRFEYVCECELLFDLACLFEFTDISMVFFCPAITPGIHELCTSVSLIRLPRLFETA